MWVEKRWGVGIQAVGVRLSSVRACVGDCVPPGPDHQVEIPRLDICIVHPIPKRTSNTTPNDHNICLVAPRFPSKWEII